MGRYGKVLEQKLDFRNDPCMTNSRLVTSEPLEYKKPNIVDVGMKFASRF